MSAEPTYVLQLYARELREHASGIINSSIGEADIDRYKQLCYDAASKLEEASLLYKKLNIQSGGFIKREAFELISNIIVPLTLSFVVVGMYVFFVPIMLVWLKFIL